MPTPSRPADPCRRGRHLRKASAQAVGGGAAEHVIRLMQQESVEMRRWCEPKPLGQIWIFSDQPAEHACCKAPRRQRPDQATVPSHRYQAEFRGLEDLLIA